MAAHELPISAPTTQSKAHILEKLRGKIVLVGADIRSVRPDKHRTPFKVSDVTIAALFVTVMGIPSVNAGAMREASDN